MLKIENLSFDVNDEKGEKEIIKDLNLEIQDGKFVVITGPNGGGKSTMAKLIMGIEKPTSGRILFDGVDITEMDVTQRARLGISFAFQQPGSGSSAFGFRKASERGGSLHISLRGGPLRQRLYQP